MGRSLLFCSLAALPLASPSHSRAGMTILHATPGDFREARVEGLRPLPFARGAFEGSGALESAAIETAFPFDNLVGSWNVLLPPGSSIELRVQVRVGDAWSGWYRLGRSGPEGGSSFADQEDSFGKVDVDTLQVKAPASALRYRVLLDASGKRPARLLRVALTYATSSSTESASSARPFQPGPWVRELEIRPRSQMEEQERYRHDICSPTSLAMVLDYWGKHPATSELVRRVQDHGSRLYGNWPLNVAAAFHHGLSGQVARLDSMEELQAEIALGRPVVASIRFGERELSGAPIRKTNGHLLVVAGFTPEGDVIVRDPAAKTRKEVRRVYRRGEFEKAWIKAKMGLAYVLGPRFPETLWIGTPTVDLRRRARAPAVPKPRDGELSTQLLYGEAVRALKARGDWVWVEAMEQAHRVRGGWSGYAGWVRAQHLSGGRPGEPDAVARHKEIPVRFLRPSPEAPLPSSWTFSMGTRLHSISVQGRLTEVLLLDGRKALVETVSLRGTGVPPSRQKIVEAAERFLGAAYAWGGRSGVGSFPGRGVDCSGLTSLAYRSEGLDLPRDADDQFARARPILRSQLKPADLVFLTHSASNHRVTHVMLYSGGEELLESNIAAGKVVKTLFQDRFGTPLTSLESGDIVMDRSRHKPLRRILRFGAYLD